jgi:hypothetical protein
MTDLTRDQERALVIAGWLTPGNAEAMAATVVRLNERVIEQHDLLVNARDLLLGALSVEGMDGAQRREAAVVVEAIEELLGLEVEQ